VQVHTRHAQTPEEVNHPVLNPLAIGVTLGGRLLDVVAPRPKPRAGLPLDISLLSERTVTRTRPASAARTEGLVGLPFAGGDGG
jgi:hypothetical protein